MSSTTLKAPRIARRLALATLALASVSAPALAQNVSNEAWLGQVGGSNTLDILQQGRGNSAGADNVWLLLGQDGSGNSLVLDQFGYDNKLGTLFANVPNYARGVWQRGDLNTIDISQIATVVGGSNMIGSVQQYSRLALALNSTASNTLGITQTGAAAQHYVGRVVQVNASGTGAQNSIVIEQSGGGFDLGNVLANVRQRGGGNSFSAVQAGQSNRIGDIPTDNGLPIGGVVQRGTGNTAALRQDGEGNLVEYLTQFGSTNAAAVHLSGNDNAVFQLLQNNEAWAGAAIGNRIEVSVSGDGNGGTGGAWVGEFIQLDNLGTPGIGQAVLQQLGDDNDLRLTIIQGVDTRYGASQFGDGNDAYLTIYALAGESDAGDNETALFQNGDLNYASHEISGNANRGTLVQLGERNRAAIVQLGNKNVATVRIDGDRNNADGGALIGDPALDVAALMPSLVRGTVSQNGQLNSLTVSVTGNDNGFVLSQSGSSHSAEVQMTGDFNSLAALQSGSGQTLIVQQVGSLNTLGVHQF